MTRLLSILVVTVALAAGPAMAEGPSKCFTSWSEAAPIVTASYRRSNNFKPSSLRFVDYSVRISTGEEFTN